MSDFQKGMSLLSAGKPQEAIKWFERSVQNNPTFAPAYFQAARFYQINGQDAHAANLLDEAAKLEPRAENFLSLSLSLNKLGRHGEAAEAATCAVELNPSSSMGHVQLGVALIGSNRPQAGKEQLAIGRSLSTKGTEAFQIGVALREIGLTEEANDFLRKSSDLEPSLVGPLCLLVHNRMVTDADRVLIPRFKRMLENPTLSPSERSSLNYGLGKVMEDLGEFEAAMSHYDEANRLARIFKRLVGQIEPKQFTQFANAAIATDFGLVDLGKEGPSLSDKPIFIVGVMRSGTTLVEQILSAHPNLCAAGEQQFWVDAITLSFDVLSGSFEMDSLHNLGGQYLQLLDSVCPNAVRTSDKMPANWMFLGAIHAALPNAFIIHLRRNPVDNLLSIWATPNQAVSDGGHLKAGAVQFYHEYMRVMAHFRSALPADRLLEIDYEDLTANPISVSRKMLEFVGLEWDDACAYPEKNQRSVRTPSAWQVRQPVYRTSVERWKRFGPWLGEFGALLGVIHPPVNK